MIKAYEYEDTIARRVQEYTCPYCGKSIQWNVPEQLSPYNCTGCMRRIADISKLVANSDWRVSYHLTEKVA